MAITKWQRDAIAELKATPQTLSSWDNCMAKGYCKWPAIGGCIIASIIIISLLWCLVRCLCCGASCCCGCCPGSRNKGHKHVDHDSLQPSPYHGYQPTPPPPSYGPPQYAQFDVSRGAKPHDDILPAMPMWEKAEHRKLQSHDNDLEMGHVDHNAGQRVPMLSNVASPVHGYHEVKGSPVTLQQFHGGYASGDLGDASYNNRPQYTAYTPLTDAESEKPSHNQDTGFGRKPVNGSWKEI
ncbi:MAG: hypothetical protein M1812_002772 [Candelaria pacifica]|nr:MAG: hypothetical protein M1812_002772 [Candelaria pacifica]